MFIVLQQLQESYRGVAEHVKPAKMLRSQNVLQPLAAALYGLKSTQRTPSK
jgi:hypothetical protein